MENPVDFIKYSVKFYHLPPTTWTRIALGESEAQIMKKENFPTKDKSIKEPWYECEELLGGIGKRDDELIHDNRMKFSWQEGFDKPDFPQSNEAAMVVHTIVNVVLLICYRKAKGLGDWECRI